MQKGISVWIFSKIVMLIFLFLTLSAVLSYMHLISERVNADSAEALTMQMKNAVQSVMIQETLSSQLVVPLPETLPEKGYGAEKYEERGVTRLYTLRISTTKDTSNNDYVSIALAWGAHEAADAGTFSYAAASWLLASDVAVWFGEIRNPAVTKSGEIYLNSESHRFFVVKRNGANVCILGCDKELCEAIECPS
jgi:hypothetical protein